MSFPLTSLALVMPAILASAVTTRAQDSSAARPPLPPPGQLVDLGGWRLHLDCSGQARAGQPTVILEAGAGDFSVDWSLVQPRVAPFARVCSYDRAGSGWSDLGPRPRTFRQIAWELHALLEKAGERPPYVLVGHSMGGWLVRQYQLTYPTQVAGMVLVESGADDPGRMMPDGKVVRSSELVTGKAIPEAKTSDPLRESDLPARMATMIREQAAAFGRTANEPPRDKLPPDAQRMRTWSLSQVKHHVTNDNPFEAEELAILRAARARSAHSLGDLPLLVVSRGAPEGTSPEARARDSAHTREQASLAALSSRGRHIVATHSGHHVPIDEPDLVAAAIRGVLARN